MCLGVLDKTRLTALQSHHCSVQDWQPLRLRRMSGSSLFLSFIPSVSLTSFSFISSPLHSFHLFFSYPCQLSFILYGLLSWLLHINGNLELPEQRSESLLLAFESGGHKCFLVPQNYILSTELFREILVRVHWLWFALTFPIGFRDLDVTCNIHCCFRCTFPPKQGSMCLTVPKEHLSVFNHGPGLLFSTGYGFKRSSNPLCGGTARNRLRMCMCVFVCFTFDFNTKWKAAYWTPQQGLTHDWADEPQATGADPSANMESLSSPQGTFT